MCHCTGEARVPLASQLASDSRGHKAVGVADERDRLDCIKQLDIVWFGHAFAPTVRLITPRFLMPLVFGTFYL